MAITTEAPHDRKSLHLVPRRCPPRQPPLPGTPASSKAIFVSLQAISVSVHDAALSSSAPTKPTKAAAVQCVTRGWPVNYVFNLIPAAGIPHCTLALLKPHRTRWSCAGMYMVWRHLNAESLWHSALLFRVSICYWTRIPTTISPLQNEKGNLTPPSSPLVEDEGMVTTADSRWLQRASPLSSPIIICRSPRLSAYTPGLYCSLCPGRLQLTWHNASLQAFRILTTGYLS